MSSKLLLEIKDLHMQIGEKPILRGLNLQIREGEVHALMGRNGCGKTSLAHVLMGHPRYQVTSGEIIYKGESILDLPVEERARRRLFLGFQHPTAIQGVSVIQFLRTAIRSVRGDEIPAKELRKRIKQEMEALEIPDAFMTRALNDGFSGGERKRLETLQLRLLEPDFSVLDETDSGLDIDALRLISKNINELRSSSRGFLLITHYQRLLDLIRPDHVHIMSEGRVVRSGGPELALELEQKGYEAFTEAA